MLRLFSQILHLTCETGAVSGFFAKAVVSSYLLRLSSAFKSGGPVRQINQNSNRSSRIVYLENSVSKLHAQYSNVSEIEVRLNLISLDSLRSQFLQPLSRKPEVREGRALTLWPYAKPLPADSLEDVPWNDCAALIAALHKVELEPQLVALGSGWLMRLSRSIEKLERMSASAERSIILEAAQTLPLFSSASWTHHKQSYIHGDWHPGQVAYYENKLVFIDIDDVGIGNRMFDLAKPAAYFLAGLLPNHMWKEFSEGYQNSCNMSQENRDTFWSELELPARAAVIQSAITALTHASENLRALQNFEIELIKSCQRVTQCHTRRIL